MKFLADLLGFKSYKAKESFLREEAFEIPGIQETRDQLTRMLEDREAAYQKSMERREAANQRLDQTAEKLEGQGLASKEFAKQQTEQNLKNQSALATQLTGAGNLSGVDLNAVLQAAGTQNAQSLGAAAGNVAQEQQAQNQLLANLRLAMQQASQQQTQFDSANQANILAQRYGLDKDQFSANVQREQARLGVEAENEARKQGEVASTNQGVAAGFGALTSGT